MNTKLLLKVRDHILAEPLRLAMETWIEEGKEGAWVRCTWDYFGIDRLQPIPRCGTIACIAGWTCLLTEQQCHGYDIELRAAELLGLEGGGKDLFQLTFWPPYWAHRYRDATSAQERAEVTASYIDHFIATGGEPE